MFPAAVRRCLAVFLAVLLKNPIPLLWWLGMVNGENATTSDSVALLPTKPLEVVSVTIPEGSTFMDIARALENNGVCSQAAFYQAAQNYTVQSFNVPSSPDRCFKMEGYLFPDTYQFYVGEDPTSVLRKMLNNYAAKSGMPLGSDVDFGIYY